MTKRICISVILLLCGIQTFSQSSTEVRDQTWLAYFNQTQFTKRSGIWADAHWRLTDHFIHKNSVSIFRLAYTYYLSETVRLTAGYSYSVNYGTPNVPEHAPWEQVQWSERKDRFSLVHWLRLEERFRRKVVSDALTDSYTFAWRFRYNLSFFIPLKGTSIVSKTPFIFITDEIMINAGKQIVNYFDQNRFGIGLGYQFTPRLNAQLGYMDVFQELADRNKYVNINAVRLFVFHNIDLRKVRD